MKGQMITSLGKLIFPDAIWRMPSFEKKIYLTFDDGPHPEITHEVLSILKKFNAKATFFCLGKNVEENKSVYSKIIKDGHGVGNHTFNHLKGWRTDFNQYINDVNKAKTLVASAMFRPPYGKFTREQYHYLKQQYKIIMWDVLAFDYEPDRSAGSCLNHCIKYLKPGSIVVMHDSEKAYKNMIYLLPHLLEAVKEKNFLAEKLNF